jgi:RNA polymerase sigma-70 factor (ECF subfamily)
MGIAEGANDVELLLTARSDAAAFEQLYRRYVRRVAGFAAGRCSCAEDVADVVAQTFARLLDVADRYDPGRAEPAAFVTAIAANVVHDVHRARARQHALVTKLAGRDLLDADDIGRIDAAIDAARSAGEVLDAVGRVPPGEQEMLRLVAQGRTPAAAAAELGISAGAGWTRLSRARRRVRRQLTASHEERD